MSKKFVSLRVTAMLEIEPKDLEWLDDEDLEVLGQRLYEALETTVPLKIKRGRTYRGYIRFLTPEPPALKIARQRFLEET